jgi:hypothetical protein
VQKVYHIQVRLTTELQFINEFLSLEIVIIDFNTFSTFFHLETSFVVCLIEKILCSWNKNR